MGRYLQPLPIEPPPNTQKIHSAQPESSLAVWVQLAVLPSPYSHNQALLLFRQTDDEWLAWVPDHGEVILHRSEFYVDSDWN